MRLAIVTKMLSPYRNPVFEELGRRPDLDLLVITISADQAHRQWDMNRLYDSARFPCRSVVGQSVLPVWRELTKFNPDVVLIGGYDMSGYFEALGYAKIHRKRVVLWSGTIPSGVRRRRGLIPIVRRQFIRSTDACVAYGTLAREFLIQSGFEPQRIFIGYNTVDVPAFMVRAAEAKSSRRSQELRQRYGPFSVIYVGRLVEHKGLELLIAALKPLRESVTLVIAGDGPLRCVLEQSTRENGIKAFFEGFLDTADLPLYYVSCDAFVFPTLYDPWGLVVNEAMACGLPIVSSLAAGATYDLVEEGRNGFPIDPRDTDQLRQRIALLASDIELRVRMGRSSSEMIEKYTPRELANSILTAARHTL